MSNKLDVQLVQYEKTVAKLADVLKHPKNGFICDAAVLRFKYTFELIWKTIQTFLEKQGIEARSPRESLREAFQAGLIDENPLWMKTIELRNLVSHTYNEKIAEEIYKGLPQILALYQDLLKKLKTHP